jgi:hypothetical protein
VIPEEMNQEEAFDCRIEQTQGMAGVALPKHINRPPAEGGENVHYFVCTLRVEFHLMSVTGYQSGSQP